MVVGARLGFEAAAGGPEFVAELGDDAVAELVAPSSERECYVRVEAFELSGVAGSADPQPERRASVRARTTRRQRASHTALLPGGGAETRRQRRIIPGRCAPALHATGGLESGHAGDEVFAGEVVRRREGVTGRRIGILLCDGGPPERAANDDAAERPRLSSQL